MKKKSSIQRKKNSSNRIWGLTGSIASGKSLAEKYLIHFGAQVIEADSIAKKLTSRGHPFLKILARKLGRDILSLNGKNLNRYHCRLRILKDPLFRKKLERLLHPRIAIESQQLISEALQKSSGPVFYSAPLLIEAGRANDFSQILVITASDPIRLKRLMSRDQMQLTQAKQLMKIQLSQKEKRKWATIEIKNNGTAAELKQKIKKFLEKLN